MDTVIVSKTLEKDALSLEHNEVLADESLQQSLDPITGRRMSYGRSLRIFTGTHSKTPFWKITARPFIVFWYPAVLWSFLGK